MKLLSFDVGIRNLAGCIMQISQPDLSDEDASPNRSIQPDHSAKIQWWKSIDLLETPTNICQVLLKDSQKCGKQCTWQGLSTSEEIKYFCGHHKSYHKIETLNISNTEEKHGCDFGNCRGRGKFMVENPNTAINSYYCQKHLTKVMAVYKSSHTIRKVKSPTCKDIPVKDLKIAIWRMLDALPHLLEVDQVIIENQPSLKNPMMKSVAETLFNYFICRGVIDRNRTNSTIDDVKYLSPSNKMKLSDDGNGLKNISNKALKYKATKQLAIQQVAERLKPQPDAREKFLNNKKKDDLADCLLQALYYAKSQNKTVRDLSVDENLIMQ